jgi:hypothetical protein
VVLDQHRLLGELPIGDIDTPLQWFAHLLSNIVERRASYSDLAERDASITPLECLIGKEQHWPGTSIDSHPHRFRSVTMEVCLARGFTEDPKLGKYERCVQACNRRTFTKFQFEQSGLQTENANTVHLIAFSPFTCSCSKNMLRLDGESSGPRTSGRFGGRW